jgi:hypothetical protein
MFMAVCGFTDAGLRHLFGPLPVDVAMSARPPETCARWRLAAKPGRVVSLTPLQLLCAATSPM